MSCHPSMSSRSPDTPATTRRPGACFRSPLAALLLLALFSPFLYAREDGEPFAYRFERSEYQEIHLPPGQRFSVVLEGTSWYINRYDREHLAFNLRKVGGDEVEFVLTSGEESTAYILFSSVSGDLYVRVFVGEHGGREEQAPGEEEREQPAQEEPAVEQPPERKPAPEPPARQPGDMYYLDEGGRVVQVPVKDEERDYKRGVTSLEAGRLEEAERHLAAYLAECTRCSSRVDALLALAEVHRRSGRIEDALDDITRALSSAEGERAAHIRLKMADLYLETGSSEKAADQYREAYRLSGDPSLLKTAGDLFFQQDQYREAVSAYEESLQAGLEDAQLLYRLAAIFDLPGETRDVQKAYRYYRRVALEHPESPLAGKARERVRFFEEHFYRYR